MKDSTFVLYLGLGAVMQIARDIPAESENPGGPLSGWISDLPSRDLRTQRHATMEIHRWRGDAKPALPSLIKCLESEDATVRQFAAGAIEEVAGTHPASIEALRPCLVDPEPEVRLISSRALRMLHEGQMRR